MSSSLVSSCTPRRRWCSRSIVWPPRSTSIADDNNRPELRSEADSRCDFPPPLKSAEHRRAVIIGRVQYFTATPYQPGMWFTHDAIRSPISGSNGFDLRASASKNGSCLFISRASSTLVCRPLLRNFIWFQVQKIREENRSRLWGENHRLRRFLFRSNFPFCLHARQ